MKRVSNKYIHTILVSLLLIPCLVFTQTAKDSLMASMFVPDKIRLLIPDINDGCGVAFRDLNGDDLPDIYVIGTKSLNRVLVNRGKFRVFDDATITSGLGGNLMSMGMRNLEQGTALFDFDNDGDVDVMVAGWGVTTDLYRNDGDWEFTNLGGKLDLPPRLDANGCFVADINNDGFLDVFLTDAHFTNRMLLNTGKGEFRDVTPQTGLEYYGSSQSGSFCDVDNDGDLDLYVNTWDASDRFYQNRGDGRFRLVNVPLEVCQKPLKSNGVCFGDINNDGFFDFCVTTSKGPFLVLNQTVPGDSIWKFEDITNQLKLNGPFESYGCTFADFNHNGNLDLYIGGSGVNRFYINRGDCQFDYLPPSSLEKRQRIYASTKGVVVADYDLDGDLDLFESNQDTISYFYINPMINDVAYIRFQVRGVKSNRDGIGTRIDLFPAGQLNRPENLFASRMISGGGGYLSMNELVVHFGLDTLRMVDVRVTFPSGKIVTKTWLLADQTVLIYEYPTFLRQVIFLSQTVFRLMNQSTFWLQGFLVLLFPILTFAFIRLGIKRYHWKAATASVYLAVFFLMALSVILFFRYLPPLTIFFVVDFLTIVFILIFVLYSERLLRLRKSRERYHSVLIQLSNQVIAVHDDESLLKMVVENISTTTEFEVCSALIVDPSTLLFSYEFCHGTQSFMTRLNELSDLESFFSAIKKKSYLLKKELKRFKSVFHPIQPDIVLAVQRNHQVYGVLLMSAKTPVPPLSQEDIDLFQNITNQMAVAIENNAYIRKSNEMVKRLTEAEVQKKYLRELENKNKALDENNHKLQQLYDELKNTEAQLIHSEKMASLGQLVAGISHELNNPIGFIYGNVKQLQSYVDRIQQFLKQGADQKVNKISSKQIDSIFPDLQNLIDDTIRGSRMVKELVESLRKFSHLDQAEWKKTNIHEGVESSLMILKPQWKERIQIHKSFDASGLIECNPGQINQVFLNMLSNAMHAIHEKGNIWIETKDLEDQVIITFRDDGSGIPKNIAGKIFDPFFTTKDVGEGIGLGLSISYSIIKNHQGSIHVKSELGKGSCFQIELPHNKRKG